MPRIIEGQELIALQPIIAAARLESLSATCSKDSRGVVVFNSEGKIIGKAANGPLWPYQCEPKRCSFICGVYAMHAERLALINALNAQPNIFGASILHLRTIDGEIQTSGPLRCADCTGYMMAIERKGIRLGEFILLQRIPRPFTDVDEACQKEAEVSDRETPPFHGRRGFILPQSNGWMAYSIPEADYITRQNLHLTT